MWFAANNILLMRSCNHALGEKMAGRFGWAVREWFKYKNKLGNRMIKQLSNSVIAKYFDLSMSRRSIICLSLRLRQIIDLLATDKSQYFAQLRPIIVNYPESLGAMLEYWYIEHGLLNVSAPEVPTILKILISKEVTLQPSILGLSWQPSRVNVMSSQEQP